MRKIVVTEFISLDGVVEDPGGAEGYEHGGWTFTFDIGDGYLFKNEELMAAETQLLGRVTYEGFAKAWPERDGDFADRMNAMPKYVVSTTLREAEWSNTTILRSIEDVRRLEGNILVAGSISLVRGLLAAGLVDELNLMIFPVVLGSGRKLFGDGEMVSLTPLEYRESGHVVIARYSFDREAHPAA